MLLSEKDLRRLTKDQFNGMCRELGDFRVYEMVANLPCDGSQKCPHCQASLTLTRARETICNEKVFLTIKLGLK